MKWPKKHACGAVISETEWASIPNPKMWEIEDGIVFEQRLCPSDGCGSHLCVQIAGPPLGDGE